MSKDDYARRRVLSAHFFSGFFRLTVLDEAGQESLRRALLGFMAVLVSAGIFIGRLYVSKYLRLDQSVPLELVNADRLFAIALPMFVTAIAMTIVSQSLFPDELDFRTLMALPIKRRTVFLAKGAALARFAALVVCTSVATMTAPLAAIISTSAPAEPIKSAVALLGSAAMGCVFACTAITSVQGLAVTLVPRRLRRRVTMWVQVSCIALLLLALPLVLRAPAAGNLLVLRPQWLALVPPVWFLDLFERSTGGRFGGDAEGVLAGFAGIVATAAIAAASYIRLYGTFDYASLRVTEHYHESMLTRYIRERSKNPATNAILSLLRATVERSAPHRFLYFLGVAVGAALAVNGLLGAIGLRERWLTQAILSVPFLLIAGSIVGLWVAFLVPSHLRARWLFRFTEAAYTRAHELNAVWQMLFWKGVFVPTVLSVPIVAMRFGARQALFLTPLILLLGTALVEAMCIGCRRIPFTCTVLFGKRPPAIVLAYLGGVFGFFVFIGAAMLNGARAGNVSWLIITFAAALGLSILRWWRLQDWGTHPLEFEDSIPDGVDALRLAGD